MITYDTIICPKCHKETFDIDFDTNTGEKDTFCTNCNYQYHINIYKQPKINDTISNINEIGQITSIKENEIIISWKHSRKSLIEKLKFENDFAWDTISKVWYLFK